MDASTTSSQLPTPERPSNGPQITRRLGGPYLLLILLALSIVSYVGLAWFLMTTVGEDVAMKERRAALSDEIETITVRLAELRGTQQLAENKAQQARGDEAETAQRLADVEQRLRNTQERLEKASSNFTSLEATYQQQQAELSGLETALKNGRSEITTLASESRSLRSQIDDLQKQASAADSDLKEREAALQTTETRLTERRETLRATDAELADTRKALTELQAARATQEVDIEVLERRSEELKAQEQALVETIAKLESRQLELARLDERLPERERALSDILSRLEAARTEQADLEAELIARRKEVGTADELVTRLGAEAAALKVRVDESKALLTTADVDRKELDMLAKRVAEGRVDAEVLERQRVEITMLRQQKTDTEARLRVLEAEVERMEPLSANVEALRREREQLLQELADLRVTQRETADRATAAGITHSSTD
ncbi:hypothetical protein [Thiocapsa sp.]|uniref:hypothetical protein n=1 Tax=Thiocapsa sp. TaxID=2024551 RepID=UPI003593CE30